MTTDLQVSQNPILEQYEWLCRYGSPAEQQAYLDAKVEDLKLGAQRAFARGDYQASTTELETASALWSMCAQMAAERSACILSVAAHVNDLSDNYPVAVEKFLQAAEAIHGNPVKSLGYRLDACTSLVHHAEAIKPETDTAGRYSLLARAAQLFTEAVQFDGSPIAQAERSHYALPDERAFTPDQLKTAIASVQEWIDRQDGNLPPRPPAQHQERTFGGGTIMVG